MLAAILCFAGAKGALVQADRAPSDALGHRPAGGGAPGLERRACRAHAVRGWRCSASPGSRSPIAAMPRSNPVAFAETARTTSFWPFAELACPQRSGDPAAPDQRRHPLRRAGPAASLAVRHAGDRLVGACRAAGPGAHHRACFAGRRAGMIAFWLRDRTPDLYPVRAIMPGVLSLPGVFEAVTEPAILLEIADRVATITLNRPDRLNAFNEAMHAQLAQRARPDRARPGDPRACC